MPTYAALGDSMSIDVYAGGPGRGAASLLLRNRDDDFPDWAGRDLRTRIPDVGFHLLATDGGTSATLVEYQLPRLVRLGVVPSLVTLTVGGNDLLHAYGDTGAAREVSQRVLANVRTALDELRSLGVEPARTAVATIYDPSDGTGDAASLGLPPWPDGVGMIAQLNEGLAVTARQQGAVVADVHQRFLGHGLLAGDPRQPSPRPAQRDLWFCQVIEPNAWGASAIRAAFWNALHPEGEQLR